ncbi:hypothetical protein C8A03DRAFT_15817 [Achaetomium macrosporum]|uniref:Uncharacterized protein n=1 Tax=Achaetomium macrosporum TaxID=79813 RepID=A0AAN7CAZ9_9PEZI|nr:hypothetical protein C8A03DRAFT_15817 [Achaetomium macrosporum]
MSQPNPDEIDLSDEDFYNDNDRNNYDDYEVAQDPALAATLGFTSFGTQDNDDSRPAKKRRFNPQSDIAIIADDASHSKTTTEHSTLTAHKAQLPTKPKPASSTDKITYSDSNDANGNGNGEGDDNDDFELDLDPDAPPSPSAGGTSTPTPAAAETEKTEAAKPTSASASAATSLPTPTLTSATPPTTAGRGGGRGALGGGRSGGGVGGINPQWYIDYYDPSSNENPWEGMEKFKGLEPVGTWLPSRWASSNDAAGVPGAAGQEVGAGAEGEGVVASTATAA